MQIKPTLLVIRAIGVEFANRIYKVVAAIVAIIIATLLGVSVWLTTLSDWWWLLVFVVVFISTVAAGVLIAIKLILRSIRPTMNKSQKKLVRAFVDKLERLSEVVQTPKIILLFQIVRDVAAPRKDGFIASLAGDSSSLKRDFVALQKEFN